MSDSFFHYIHMDDESGQSSFSFAGTESGRGYHILEGTSCLHPVSQAPHTPNSACLEPRGSALPANCPADPHIHTDRSAFATATQFDSSTFVLPPTLRAPRIPLYTSGNSPPSDYDSSLGAYRYPLISECSPNTVAMPTLTRHAQDGNCVIDTHTCHHDPPFGFLRDNYLVEHPRALPSSFVATTVAPTSFGAIPSSHMYPVFPWHPAPGRSPRHPTAAFQDLPSFNSTLSLSPSESFDSDSYSSPSPPLSMGSPTPVVPPSEMSSQTQLQPYVAASIGQLYTSTVPSEAIEFPPLSGAEEAPFFQCRWANCGIWITCEKEAVRNHLTRVHNVVLKGTSAADSARCDWVGCSSSPQRNGLVRHFQTHLGLKWLCSVCETAYTRQDSVGFHARKDPRCKLARAISRPSAVAYRARMNEDNTVTLTKILQP